MNFAGFRIGLGVTGGIAAYKAADLTSKLVQAGALVDVMLTEGALQFIQPATFNALTRRPVHRAASVPWSETAAGHVSLAAEIDLLLIAPATANTIARLAAGFADDMLSAVTLATQSPILIAPAMETHMWRNAATQHNLQILRERGFQIIEPEAGRLASGATGEGRLAAIDTILERVSSVLADGPLRGRTVVVSAGGTKEAIDPVRFIGNRSSGRMGVAIAREAKRLGANVTLVAVDDVHVPNSGLHVVRVVSARDMEAAVHEAIPGADVLVMAAAVADFRPVAEANQKIKKQPGQTEMNITLTRNPDIIAGIDQPGLLKVGFAAETEDLQTNARHKLQAKGLAMIVANDAVATIGSEHSTATLLFADRDPVQLPNAPKQVVAEHIVREIVHLLEAQHA